MPFIPHTASEVEAMLKVIGVRTIENLFDEIPSELRLDQLKNIPPALNEQELSRLMQEKLAQDPLLLNFIGAGAYEHYIPAATWELANRGEFMTAYTPYQAEASQASLQVIYEYQTMIASLTGLEVSNASLYDGATALAEALLMAVRIKHKPRVLIPKTVHPVYRIVARTLLTPQSIELVEIAYDWEQGTTDIKALTEQEEFSALVIPQPNFFGMLEPIDTLTDWVHEQDALVIGLVNPISLGLLKEPGQWGTQGADLACGEGQPLGIPLCFGGPYFGFLCTRKSYVRQLPGRIVGCTEDHQKRKGFTLTLQAREQHIRRGKATSNICTNQGLAVTAATIYLSLLGPEGLKNIAAKAHSQTSSLISTLTEITGVKQRFTGDYFHESVFELPLPIAQVLTELESDGIQGGYDLSTYYPELKNAILICVTETKNDADLIRYQQSLKKIVC